jgi:hypothetical protein
MKAFRITKQDIEKDFKRVNLSLSIEDAENLFLVAEYNGNQKPTALASAWVKQRASIEAQAVRKTAYVPKAQRGGNLFENVKSKGKKK